MKLLEKTLNELNAIDNLIAVLHCDGGHYREQHGRLKAIEDAQELIHKEWINKGIVMADQILLKDQISELKIKLAAVIDACEDKGGQFRAWHQHLRETTRAGKELLEKIK